MVEEEIAISNKNTPEKSWILSSNLFVIELQSTLRYSYGFDIDLQVGLQCLFHLVGFDGGFESGNNQAILVNHELCEVPLDLLDERPFRFGLQIFPQWMSLVAVDVDLLVHVEGHVVFLDEVKDVLWIVKFLVHEVARGEREDSQTFALVFLVQGLELLVIGIGQTAFAGYVYNN